jgi:hypothetical protein
MRNGGAFAALAGPRAACWRRMAGAMVLALSAASCSTLGQMIPAPTADIGGTTVAFESVDGPPAAVVHKIVRDLSTEATARQIVVVPRGGEAMYRIRGYLAVHAEAGQTTIAWAWDVYDGGQRRVFRLRGEDSAGSGSRAWSAADDQTLRRIARSSVDQLALFLASARVAGIPEPAAPPPSRSFLVGLDDFTPESAGIFRVFRPAPVPMAIDPSPETLSGDVPLPPDRPAPARGGSGTLAYAN